MFKSDYFWGLQIKNLLASQVPRGVATFAPHMYPRHIEDLRPIAIQDGHIQYPTTITVTAGETFQVDIMKKQHRQALVLLHESLSMDTVYARYFSPRSLASRLKGLRERTRINLREQLALVVTVEEKVVAVVRVIKIPGRKAEVAFLVRDDHQKQGIGRALFTHVISYAQQEPDIDDVVASTLPENVSMQKLFIKYGFTHTHTDGNGAHYSRGVKE